MDILYGVPTRVRKVLGISLYVTDDADAKLNVTYSLVK